MSIPNQAINTLIQNIQSSLTMSSDSLDIDVQWELSKLLSILQRINISLAKASLEDNKIKQSQLESIVSSVEIAVYSLQGSPKKIFAKQLRRNTEIALRKLENPFQAFFINSFKNFLYLTTTPSKVLIGLFIALPIHFLAPVILTELLINSKNILTEEFPILSLSKEANASKTSDEVVESKIPLKALSSEEDQSSESELEAKLTEYDFDEAAVLLVLCAISGSTGSVISILTRIEEYKNEEYTDTFLPIYVGAFKPMIGAAFGILVFVLLSSTLLPISVVREPAKPSTKWFTLMSIAFIVGFSERFAKDIVSSVETRIMPTSENDKQKQLPATSEETAVAEMTKLATFPKPSNVSNGQTIPSDASVTLPLAPSEKGSL